MGREMFLEKKQKVQISLSRKELAFFGVQPVNKLWLLYFLFLYKCTARLNLPFTDGSVAVSLTYKKK